jgi:hypothetical protein
VDLEHISVFEDIETLVIKNCQSVKLAGLSECFELESISITFCNLSDLSEFDSPMLVDLKYLDLSNNEIADLEPLLKLTDLTELNLSHNKISDLQQFLFLIGMKKLLIIDLTGNPSIFVETDKENPKLKEDGDSVSLECECFLLHVFYEQIHAVKDAQKFNEDKEPEESAREIPSFVLRMLG